MATREINYELEAHQDAARIALHFLDEIVEQIQRRGKAYDRLYDWYEKGEKVLDRYRPNGFSVPEATALLGQLETFIPDDERIWKGKSSRSAISIMAVETYVNAVYVFWEHLIYRINKAVKGFLPGPKDWSPIKRKSLKEFVKDQIQSEFNGD